MLLQIYIATFIFARKNVQDKTINNNFNQKKFKINLNCFFFVKVGKGRCQFQQTFLNFRLKVSESHMPCDPTPLLPPFWIDLLLHFSLSLFSLSSHKVTGSAIFFFTCSSNL